MKCARHLGWFDWVLLLLAALLAGEAFLWVHYHRQTQRATIALDHMMMEGSRLSRLAPIVDEANGRAIEHEVAASEQTLAAWRATSPARSDHLASVPASMQSSDVFFELLAWTARMRALAADSHVAIRPDESFGFASLVNEGPPAELAVAVWRQRLRLEYLLAHLFAAHPLAVKSVQREYPRPVTPLEPASRPADSSRVAVEAMVGQNPDYFVPDPRLLKRNSGPGPSEAFRLEFTGETPVLRALLNRLARGDEPVLVRSVAVEPLSGATTAISRGERASSVESLPLVAPAPSRFMVVVEWLDTPFRPKNPAP